jgi:hypothetical protein
MNDMMFSWRKAILKSELAPTTRHVLLTLACHMNAVGESCFPSIKLLCEETGLSNRSVITHLQIASEIGWITVGKHGFGGQRWAAHEYRPSWPHHLRKAAEEFGKAVNEVHHHKEKAVKEVHNLSKEAVNLVQEGGEPNDTKAVKEVHTSNPRSNSESKPVTLLPDKSGEEKSSSETELQAACRATWISYRNAYFARYAVDPIRNAAVNTAIKNFVKKLPYHEAPHVAVFFLSHNDKFYVQKTHHVSLLMKDAEGLRTQWATGRTMTASKATQVDRTSGNADAVREAIEMYARKNNAAI